MMLSTAATEFSVRMFQAQKTYSVAAACPTYAAILDGCIDDVRSGGPICDLLQGWDGKTESAFALRLLGALHRLALDGKASELARFFLTTGGAQNPDHVWPVAREALIRHRDFMLQYATSPPQTNEAARSSVLWGGFLTIASQFKHPMRLREIGASAGLNLMWDQFSVSSGSFTWGPPNAALALTTRWEGSAPELAPFTISDRAACDREPIDIHSIDGRARLESYIWPDQLHRMDRLRKACAIAQRIPFRLDRADAADWVTQELRVRPQGQTTVVYHSIFRQYLPADTDAKLQSAMDEAGTRATDDSPLAWMAMEIPNANSYPDLTLTTWPGGETRKLATAHHHGDWIKWF
ncbi:MAG: DUF2332 domain-containing protein [Rhodospirillaceae bacterium]|nr:DUF2332 domain-containing protein [Rhodospirillaceae bacterium]